MCGFSQVTVLYNTSSIGELEAQQRLVHLHLQQQQQQQQQQQPGMGVLAPSVRTGSIGGMAMADSGFVRWPGELAFACLLRGGGGGVSIDCENEEEQHAPPDGSLACYGFPSASK
jgi:hypothetical protein